MASRQAVQFENLRSVANGSVTASFAALGTPLLYPCRILSIVNTCNQDMLFSTDGTNSKFIVPQSSYKIYDFGANRFSEDQTFTLPANTQIYIKYSSMPNSGSVYLECIYGVSTVNYPGEQQQ